MHIVRPYQTSVTLFSRDGDVWNYKSIADALKQLGYRWICNNVSAHFRSFSHAYRDTPAEANSLTRERTRYTDYPLVPVYEESAFIMRDDSGEPVTAATFQEFITQRYWSGFRSPFCSWNGEGPVPRTRKRKSGRHYYRKIRCHNAFLLQETFLEEGEVEPRAKRRLSNLPDARDGYRVSNRENRSWKSFRKTQWRE